MLFISESNVKKYVNAIYHKPGVSNRMGLAAPPSVAIGGLGSFHAPMHMT